MIILPNPRGYGTHRSPFFILFASSSYSVPPDFSDVRLTPQTYALDVYDRKGTNRTLTQTPGIAIRYDDVQVTG